MTASGSPTQPWLSRSVGTAAWSAAPDAYRYRFGNSTPHVKNGLTNW